MRVWLHHPDRPTDVFPLDVGREVGRGGEASVHIVPVVPADCGVSGPIVLKLYHQEVMAKTRGAKMEKIAAMVAAHPSSPALCWPLAAVADAHGEFVGFVMPMADLTDSVPWAVLANSSTRKARAPQFSYSYAVRACANLAAAVMSAHGVGAVIGDLNESNLLVANDARLTVVDCDSVQFSSPRCTWRCEVGKPEFTAPELSGTGFADQDRTVSSDVFAFAIAVFQMLTGGSHPYDGVPVDLDSDPPSTTERIKNGWCPALGSGSSHLRIHPRVPVAALPKALLPLWQRSLLSPPDQRPSMAEWHTALVAVGANLARCQSGSHDYDKRDATCGWCAHVTTGLSDPWSQHIAQVGMNPVPFLPPATPNARGAAVAPSPYTASPGAVPQHPGQGHLPAAPHYYPQGQGSPASPQSPMPPGPPQPPVIEFTSWLDLAFRHPVQLLMHILDHIPEFWEITPAWRAKKVPAAYNQGTGATALRLATALMGAVLAWVAVFASLRWVAGQRDGSIETHWVLLANIGSYLVSVGAITALVGYLVAAFKQGRSRLWSGWCWGDTWRLPVLVLAGQALSLAGAGLLCVWAVFSIIHSAFETSTSGE